MSDVRNVGIVDFERLLAAWNAPRRRIGAIHLHQTGAPGQRDFRGGTTIESMRLHHTLRAGLRDLAQHLTIDPFGGIWFGRPFEQPPASARGHNGSASEGPLMIEIVGDFGDGRDKFEGEQKNATYAVVVAILRKFGLGADAVRFHHELNKARDCPGRGIAADAFRKDVASLLAGKRSLELPRRAADGLDDGALRGLAQRARGRDVEAGGQVDLEREYGEVPETADSAVERQLLADLLERGALDASRGAAARDAGFDVGPLLPYVINLSRGVLSSEGSVSSGVGGGSSSRSSLRAIVEQHLPAYIQSCEQRKARPHVVFYAHGGLVGEDQALCYARTVAPWWLAHGVYPIFFVWESSLLETLLPSWATKRGIGDVASAVSDTGLELATQLAARPVWARMKQHAEDASSPRIESQGNRVGGAFLFAGMLKELLAAHPKLGLHAIGHSTGPILLSRFMPLLIGGDRAFDSLSYLAPAIRTDVFARHVMPLLGSAGAGGKPGIRSLTMYTMDDAAERQDNVLKAYRKSLLYYVRNACEDNTGGRILGLAKDVFADAGLSALFGVGKDKSKLSYRNGSVAVEFSPARDAGRRNPHTAATAHGAFDNDADTMFSVLGTVLGAPRSATSARTQFPSNQAFAACGLGTPVPGDADRAIGDAGCPCCGQGLPPSAAAVPAPERFGDDVSEDDPEFGGDCDTAPGGAGATPQPSTGDAGHDGARRLAVCVGIDSYPDAPLAGCIADSERWAGALEGMGFTVRRIVDRDATRAAILQALRKLIAEGRPGDDLVFQFAGHGTQIEDIDGDESDGLDEAFVPVDYKSGALMLDDDFYQEIEALRAGAYLTLFMDCCHSGSNSRFALANAAPKGGDRVRFLRLDDATRGKFFAARGRKSMRRGGGERPAPPGVVHFAACRDNEFAWESGGQGDFTRIAAPLLEAAVRGGGSNQAFIDAVVEQFGAQPRQHPLLFDPAPGLTDRRLLGR